MTILPPPWARRCFLSLFACVLCTASGLAQIRLWKDLNQQSLPSRDSYFHDDYWAELGGELYFFARSDPEDPWRLHATSGVTGHVRVIPGPGFEGLGGFRGEVLSFGGRLLFSAYTRSHGFELWSYSPSTAKFEMLADLSAGAASSSPKALTPAGSFVYFFCEHGGSWYLARTDGRAAGTSRIAPIGSKQSMDLRPRMVAWGTKLYFAGEDSSAGVELWVSDGSAAGTQRLVDVWPGKDPWSRYPHSSGPEVWGVLNGRLFFRAASPKGLGLWVTDGTAVNTHPFPSSGPGAQALVLPGSHVELGKDWYYLASDGSLGPGPQLWRTDGTAQGTFAVPTRDGLPYRVDSGTPFLCGARLVFQAFDSASGRELWVTDGTKSGTHVLQDIAPGVLSSGAWPVVSLGTRVLFSADDGTSGREFWSTDGTAKGTRMLETEPGPGSGATAVGAPIGPGRAVLVTNTTRYGVELFTTDGTPAGTGLLKDLTGPPATPNQGAHPSYLTPLDGQLWFTADDGGGRFLHVMDDIGKTRRIMRLDGLRALVDGTGPFVLPVADRHVFVSTSLQSSQQQLHAVDASAPGGRLLMTVQMAQSFVSGAVGHLVGYRYVFVQHTASHGRELWVTDGTSAGTQLLADIAPGIAGSDPHDGGFALFAGRLWFSADGPGARELWVTDGTPSGTRRFADLRPGALGSDPRELTVSQGRLFFTADDGIHGRELWSSDGTLAGTAMLRDLYPGSPSSSPRELVRLDDKLFFFATYVDGSGQRVVPHTSDGTSAGTRPAAMPLHFNVRSGSVRSLGDRAMFLADPYYNTGYEPWVSDGSASGTYLLADVQPGFRSSSVSQVQRVGRRAYFLADDGKSGKELWVTDGTIKGTKLYQDLVPGPSSAFADNWGSAGPILAGGKLVFAANHPQAGNELHVIDLPGASSERLRHACHPEAPRLSSSAPVLGSRVRLDVWGAPRGWQSVLVFGVPAEPTHLIPGICASFLDPWQPFFSVPAASTASHWSVNFDIPSAISLQGLRLVVQGLHVTQQSRLEVQTSSGLAWTLGF